MKQGFSTIMFILFIIIIATIGYFSWKNLSHPAQYVVDHNETIGDLHSAKPLDDEEGAGTTSDDTVPTQGNQAILPSSTSGNSNPTTSTGNSNSATSTGNSNTTSNTSPKSDTTTTSSDTTLGTLKNLLQQKTVLKMGSKGPAVGAVQKVMNAYFTKNLKIDNDFGKTLETDLKKFQTQNKITPTGQTGPQTLQKLIDWVGKHPLS
jgi:hypothetical protein